MALNKADPNKNQELKILGGDFGMASSSSVKSLIVFFFTNGPKFRRLLVSGGGHQLVFNLNASCWDVEEQDALMGQPWYFWSMRQRVTGAGKSPV